ncbi:hypothetical protein Nepgr_006753 [Nepenthes gracilis]|uniref:Uncharacterized protein n=1 Tax=Nepenthes gracilis TaxID=150966 RepID=A0AAD3S5R1_NEPGR|nr:hypothetical protein Nepgr_006753 [Nepenthes gracilis]
MGLRLSYPLLLFGSRCGLFLLSYRVGWFLGLLLLRQVGRAVLVFFCCVALEGERVRWSGAVTEGMLGYALLNAGVDVAKGISCWNGVVSNLRGSGAVLWSVYNQADEIFQMFIWSGDLLLMLSKSLGPVCPLYGCDQRGDASAAGGFGCLPVLATSSCCHCRLLGPLDDAWVWIAVVDFLLLSWVFLPDAVYEGDGLTLASRNAVGLLDVGVLSVDLLQWTPSGDPLCRNAVAILRAAGQLPFLVLGFWHSTFVDSRLCNLTFGMLHHWRGYCSCPEVAGAALLNPVEAGLGLLLFRPWCWCAISWLREEWPVGNDYDRNMAIAGAIGSGCSGPARLCLACNVEQNLASSRFSDLQGAHLLVFDCGIIVICCLLRAYDAEIPDAKSFCCCLVVMLLKGRVFCDRVTCWHYEPLGCALLYCNEVLSDDQGTIRPAECSSTRPAAPSSAPTPQSSPPSVAHSRIPNLPIMGFTRRHHLPSA